jgi:hypothetical protein
MLYANGQGVTNQKTWVPDSEIVCDDYDLLTRTSSYFIKYSHWLRYRSHDLTLDSYGEGPVSITVKSVRNLS